MVTTHARLILLCLLSALVSVGYGQTRTVPRSSLPYATSTSTGGVRIYSGLDQTGAGFALDATAGKLLKSLVDANTATLASLTANISSSTDAQNTSATALYITPNADGQRLFFGRSGKSFYALNFANVTGWESVPPFRFANGGLQLGVDADGAITRMGNRMTFNASSNGTGNDQGFEWYGSSAGYTSVAGGAPLLAKLTTGGNFGIGIQSPTAKLHVVGDAIVTGALTTGAASLTYNSTGKKVITGATVEQVFSSVDQALLAARATGILSGGALAINMDATRFNVAAGTGTILNLSDPANPVYTRVSWPASTSVLPAATAGNASYIYFDAAGALQQLTTKPSNSQMRLLGVFVGKVQTNASGTVVATQMVTDPVQGAANLIGDLANGIGVFVQNGARISGTTGLSIAIGAGQLYDHGGFFQAQPTDPSTANIAAASPKGFRYLTQTGASTGNDIFALDPAKYDNAGTITTVPAGGGLGVTRVTNQRVYLYPSGNVRIQYGQKFYDSMGDAQAGIGTEAFVTNPNQVGNSVLVAILTMQVTATATNDVTKVIITPASRFGEVGGGGSSAVTSTSANVSITGTSGVTVTQSGNVYTASGVPASASAVGVVKPGTGLAVAADGTLNAATYVLASASPYVPVSTSGTSFSITDIMSSVFGQLVLVRTQAEIQTLINALPTSTTAIPRLFFFGKYDFSATANSALTVSKNVELIGINGAVFDGGTTNGFLMLFKNISTRLLVENITFRSNATTSPYALVYCNEEGDSRNVTFRNARFSAPKGNYNAFGANAWNGSAGCFYDNWTFDNCVVDSVGRMGYEFLAHKNDGVIRIRNLVINNCQANNVGLYNPAGVTKASAQINGMGWSFSGDMDGIQMNNPISRNGLIGIESVSAKNVTIVNPFITGTRSSTYVDSGITTIVGAAGFSLTDGGSTDGGTPGRSTANVAITGGYVNVVGKGLGTYYADRVSITGTRFLAGAYLELQHATRLNFNALDYEMTGKNFIASFEDVKNSQVRNSRFSRENNTATPIYNPINLDGNTASIVFANVSIFTNTTINSGNPDNYFNDQQPYRLRYINEAGTNNSIQAIYLNGIKQPDQVTEAIPTVTITSGTSTTLLSHISQVVFNPATTTTITSYSLTLPTASYDRQEIRVLFGGTLTTGAVAVKSLTIIGPGGQTPIWVNAPSIGMAGQSLHFQYDAIVSRWRLLNTGVRNHYLEVATSSFDGSGNTNVAATAGFFKKLPFPNVTSDPEGLWDSSNFWYNAPEAGQYVITTVVRPKDGITAGKRYGQGSGVTAADNPTFLWTQTNTSSNGSYNQRIMSLTAGQQVFCFFALDGFDSNLQAYMTIYKLP